MKFDTQITIAWIVNFFINGKEANLKIIYDKVIMVSELDIHKICVSHLKVEFFFLPNTLDVKLFVCNFHFRFCFFICDINIFTVQGKNRCGYLALGILI